MKPTTAQEELAFLQSLVRGSDNFQRHFGQIYFAAGAIYCGQMLLHAAQAAGWIADGPSGLLIGLGPTLLFLGVLTWLLKRQVPAPPTAANRAVGVVFGGAGMTNLAMVAVVGGAAWRAGSLEVWLIYPSLVAVLQGLAWMVAWQVRRRAWYGFVALGWFATGVGMGFLVDAPVAYLTIAGTGMFAFMLVPGWVMMRQPRAD